MMENIPPFLEAESLFKKILIQNNKPTNLVWLFREDFICIKLKLWIKFPYFQDHINAAKKLYKKGVDSGYGIQLNQIGEYNDISFCNIWFPQSRGEADYAMMHKSLKMGFIKFPTYEIQIIKNISEWHILKLRSAKQEPSWIELEIFERTKLIS